MKLSKLRIVDREKRIVEYNDGGEVVTIYLSMAQRCNAGDVQKSFNHYVRQKDYDGALALIESRRARGT